MKLAHPFSTETRLLFMDLWECALCGENGQENGGLELHHIWGRINESPFNACVLCKKCHGHVGHSLQERIKCFVWTVNKLSQQGYSITQEDENFFKKIEDNLVGARRLGLL